MMQTIMLIVPTALLSSGLTLVLAWLLYRLRLEKLLDQQLEQIQIEFEARVKSGVTAAAMDMLPELRAQVKLGFLDALQESRAAGLVEDTAKVMATGAGLVENGLSVLLGLGSKTRR
ncbi:MAG: hypothetical protein ACRETM_08165 [Stenotrophobium sp.]